jgi:hypothetical protein
MTCNITRQLEVDETGRMCAEWKREEAAFKPWYCAICYASTQKGGFKVRKGLFVCFMAL